MTFDAFLAPHAAWSRGDREISVATHGQPRRAAALRVRSHPIPIERQIHLWRDIRALYHLTRLFEREQFDVVHSVTPKAGLLAMLAAMLAGIPVRLHTFTGQVWVTRRGFSRYLLKFLDCIIGASATGLLADSRSQAGFLVSENVVTRSRIAVIADGSICGVDVSRFSPDTGKRAEIRRELGVSDGAFVFVFIGRLNRDKGLVELAEAFAGVASRHPRACLVFVGPDEGRLRSELEWVLRGCMTYVRFVGATVRPEVYMMAADTICLPSHREGFGSVLIESAACGCPCVASRIYGITDAVVDGVTGLLHAVRDVRDLSAAMERLLVDPALVGRLGANAMDRARALFAEEQVVEGLAAYHRNTFKP